MKQKALFLVLVLALAGCSEMIEDPIINKTPSCNKENDCCTINNDCLYAFFTGGCHTQEYIQKIAFEARQKGTRIGEAPKRENVTCSCQDNKCLTHG